MIQSLSMITEFSGKLVLTQSVHLRLHQTIENLISFNSGVSTFCFRAAPLCFLWILGSVIVAGSEPEPVVVGTREFRELQEELVEGQSVSERTDQPP